MLCMAHYIEVYTNSQFKLHAPCYSSFERTHRFLFSTSLIVVKMAHRLSVKDRRVAASLIEVYQSPTRVQGLFRMRFGREPPTRVTLRRLYKKFVETGSVADNCKGNSGSRA